MSVPRKRTTAGFTIIEVLIVLAIAGLIMMIVFLAVPALQRNSRNNQRKQNAAAILQKISNFELNNTGDIPTTTVLRARLAASSSGLTVYDVGDITVTPGQFGVPINRAAVTNVASVEVYNYQRCSTTVDGAGTATGAGYTDVVALYAVETSNGGHTSQCQQL